MFQRILRHEWRALVADAFVSVALVLAIAAPRWRLAATVGGAIGSVLASRSVDAGGPLTFLDMPVLRAFYAGGRGPGLLSIASNNSRACSGVSASAMAHARTG